MTRACEHFRAELQAEMLAFVQAIESGRGYGAARTDYIAALRSDD
jgi:hypothetical protein